MEFTIWPEHVEAYLLFTKMQTQWQFKPMGGVSGLNYESVIAMLKLIVDKKKLKSLFRQIQLLERGFLNAINQKN